MLMEQLFARGIMAMGPAPNDPQRQVGTFNMQHIADFPSIRRNEMQKFAWIAGDWNSTNSVPETSQNPAYTDHNTASYKFCEGGNWICLVRRDGKEKPYITFDPFSRQWMYLLTEGAYGIMRSPGWDGNRIVFTGPMMMIGVDCELRQTWTKTSDDEFSFVNEEKLADGSWGYVDQWSLKRK